MLLAFYLGDACEGGDALLDECDREMLFFVLRRPAICCEFGFFFGRASGEMATFFCCILLHGWKCLFMSAFVDEPFIKWNINVLCVSHQYKCECVRVGELNSYLLLPHNFMFSRAIIFAYVYMYICQPGVRFFLWLCCGCV